MEDIWLYYFFCTFDLSLTYYLVTCIFYGIFLMFVETAVIWSLCLRPNRHNLILSIIAKFSLPSEYVGLIQTLCGALLCPDKFLNWNSPILLIISGQDNAGLLFKILWLVGTPIWEYSEPMSIHELNLYGGLFFWSSQHSQTMSGKWEENSNFPVCLSERQHKPEFPRASLFIEQWDLEKIQMLLLQEEYQALWCIMARLTSTMGSRLLTFDVGQTPYGEGDNHFASGFSRNLVGNRILVPWGRYLEIKTP